MEKAVLSAWQKKLIIQISNGFDQMRSKKRLFKGYLRYKTIPSQYAI